MINSDVTFPHADGCVGRRHLAKEKSMNVKVISAVAAGGLLLSVGAAHSATTLMQIGRSPFHRPPLASTSDFLKMVQTQAADVEKGFIKAGYPQLYQPFMEQIGSADIQLLDFPKGTHFDWMFFKRKGNGDVRVARDLTWGNKVPFPAYTFGILSEGRKYNFVVPLGCGNVALLNVEDVVVEEMVEEVAVENQMPICRASVAPVKTYWGEAVSVDASRSSDADGRVVGMKMVAKDADGNVLGKELVSGGLKGSLLLPRGAKAIEVTVVDDAGAAATSPACMVAVEGKSRVNMVADVGAYHMFDPGNWAFGRIGLEYHVNDAFSVLGLAGFAPHTGGEDGDSAGLVDLLGEYRMDRFFVNFGLGGWLSKGNDDIDYEDKDLDVIAGFGFRLGGDDGGFNTSLFTEMRSGVDELGKIIDCGRFGAGLRLRF